MGPMLHDDLKIVFYIGENLFIYKNTRYFDSFHPLQTKESYISPHILKARQNIKSIKK